MEITSKNINELKQHLGVVQNMVIGLFRPRFYPADQYIPVIEDDNGQLTCIEVGTLLGLSTLHISAASGNYVTFPNGATLAEMMQTPLEFHAWYKEYVYNPYK